jgi:hypothetical protein
MFELILYFFSECNKVHSSLQGSEMGESGLGVRNTRYTHLIRPNKDLPSVVGPGRVEGRKEGRKEGVSKSREDDSGSFFTNDASL